ncbi:MAG: hypothetical protein MZV64_72860 [Ignavibacteriales bacterium]|nr:hypothetical protein [Ignavibacteriales bacterium]
MIPRYHPPPTRGNERAGAAARDPVAPGSGPAALDALAAAPRPSSRGCAERPSPDRVSRHSSDRFHILARSEAATRPARWHPRRWTPAGGPRAIREGVWRWRRTREPQSRPGIRRRRAPRSSASRSSSRANSKAART